jgi:hypothetical protein
VFIFLIRVVDLFITGLFGRGRYPDVCGGGVGIGCVWRRCIGHCAGPGGGGFVSKLGNSDESNHGAVP